MWKESSTAVDKFAKLGNGLDEVGVDEFSDPLGGLLTVLCLELDFEYTIPTAQNQSSTTWAVNCRVRT
jgi:hypothetical protein